MKAPGGLAKNDFQGYTKNTEFSRLFVTTRFVLLLKMQPDTMACVKIYGRQYVSGSNL